MNVTLFGGEKKSVFLDMINLRILRGRYNPGLYHVGLKCHPNYPYKREEERKDTQRREQRGEDDVKREAD